MLGRKLGSSPSPAPAATPLTPGKTGCGKVLVAGGSGATKPSKPAAVGPTRKALCGVDEPEFTHVGSFITGLTQVTGWIRPVPRSGTSTKSTPFKRPYRMLYPPRTTVF